MTEAIVETGSSSPAVLTEDPSAAQGVADIGSVAALRAGFVGHREFVSLGTQPMLQLAARVVSPLTSARRVSILLVEDGEKAWLSAAEGVGAEIGQAVDLGPGIASEVLRTQASLLIRDLSNAPFPSHPERGYSTRSCMAVPVRWGERLYGVICAADPAGKSTFRDDDLASMELVGQQLGAGLHALVYARALADVDALTGVATRRLFEDRLLVEGERARRFGRPVSLLVVDVDNLKLLNDREGQWVGDQALRRIARALQQTMRRVDLVSRYGGDEFAVILPETPALESLVAARRLAQNLHQFSILTGENSRVAVRACIGVATMPPASSPKELLEQAYRALHVAKGDREGLRHWDLGALAAHSDTHSCTCRSCGKTFMVNSLAERRTRRYCSNSCSAAARREPKRERNLAIAELRKSGLTLRAIAEQYKISEERVRQICDNVY